MPCSTCQPTLIRRLVNVSGAIKRVAHAMVNGERVFSFAEMKHKRITICKGCRNYNNGWCVDYTDSKGETVKGCGCQISWKASIQSEEGMCPRRLW